LKVTELTNEKEIERILQRRWNLMFSHFKLNRKLLDMMGVYDGTNTILKHFVRYAKIMGLSKFDSVLYYYYIHSRNLTTIYKVWNENLKLIGDIGYIENNDNYDYYMYTFTSKLEANRWLYAYRMTKKWLLNNYE